MEYGTFFNQTVLAAIERFSFGLTSPLLMNLSGRGMRLINTLLPLVAVYQSSAAGAPLSTRWDDCHHNHYPGPVNPSFETGTLAGWSVLNGNAFGNGSVSSSPSYWGGPFNQVGTYFMWGFAASGDPAVGQLISSTFQASSVMSFLVSGGWDPVNLYIGLVRESDGALLLNQTGTNDEAFIRIVWDTSAWVGENVHLIAYDNSTATSWGHISLDDVRTGCDALGDNGLTFNVLGQSNQPTEGSLPTSTLYASDPIRPQFHYTPYQGWINDPAGLIQWNGKHHLFSQYNPVAPQWGPMHWSHADSTDGVHWTNLPVALYPPDPNNPQDTSGRFTGSAIQDGSEIRLIFTDDTDVDFHPSAVPEVISTATSTDGVTFSLYAGDPIVAGPPADSPSGFRDPKVFKDPTDNIWKMVVGSGDTVSGKVQLYSSTDLLSWNYVGVLFEGSGSTGTMWECPNFFPLDGKWVLFYGGDNLGWYEVGNYNGSIFTSEKTGLLDAGPDSYAMQWYEDESGRNLAITWMGNWVTSKWPSRVNGWAGSQSVIRELFIRSDGGLGSKPIQEITNLASAAAHSLGQTNVHGTITVGNSNMALLSLAVDLGSTNAPSFTVKLLSSSAESVLLTYTTANQTLTLDTTNAGYGQAGTWQASIDTSGGNSNSTLTLDILIDRSSLEIFAGDGTVMTAGVFPRYEESNVIEIVAHGGKAVFESITLTPFGSSWAS